MVDALDDFSPLQKDPYAKALTKFEDLIAQQRSAFLLGAGASTCAGLPLTAALTEAALLSSDLDDLTKQILEDLKEKFDGVGYPNIEDYLSEIIDLLAICERRRNRGAADDKASLNGNDYTLDQLQIATDQIKGAIAKVINCDKNIEIHRRFIRAVHRTQRPGIANFHQRVEYLILNYDTLIEDALGLETLKFADGLNGGATAWWDVSVFDRQGLDARVFKLHGSIDWVEFLDDRLPRRIPPNLSYPNVENKRVLIWPASTKYMETQRDPYAQLMGLARMVLRPDVNTQRVLVVCGYSFGDAHINLEIESALKDSSERLTVVVFSSELEPTGKLLEWYNDVSLTDQVVIFSKRGFFHGSISERSDVDLPWWKFENITRILEGAK